MKSAVILEDILNNLNKKDSEKILLVYSFSKKHLSSILRRDNISYFQHCLELANVVMEFSKDSSLIAVALLHDLLVDEEGKFLLNISPLNTREKALIRKMNRLRRLHINESTDDLDLVVDMFVKAPDLVLLRMAHRMNDVRNLARFDEDVLKKIADESLHIYASMAERLGFHRWKREMENISFKFLFPDLYKDLEEIFKKNYKLDMLCLNHAKDYLLKKLEENVVKADISFRIKDIYSTYRKMTIKSRKFEDLKDRLALRIVVEDLEDCYKVLCIVHSCMHPIPGKLKDYIGSPKANGYRSLHTVVYPLPGITEQPFEVQIRTTQIHEECEYGIISHHNYKNLTYNLSNNASRVDLFKNLEFIKRNIRSPKEFESALRSYFRQDTIMIFDSKDNMYHFKSGMTALDFALLIYHDECKYLELIKINGREQAIDTKLMNGDVIEVIFNEYFENKMDGWEDLDLQKDAKRVLEVLKGIKLF